MATTIGSFDLASLKNLRDDVTQYFWFESDSSSAWGSGAHVTLYPESQFTNSTSPNYMKGQNIIMNTDGFSIRNGGLPMMTLDNDSLDFNAVDTTQGTYATIATFGLTGATIGQTSGAHLIIDADGQRFYGSDGRNTLATFGASVAQIGSSSDYNVLIDRNSVDINYGSSTLSSFSSNGLYIISNNNRIANIGYSESPHYLYYTLGTRLDTNHSVINDYSSSATYSVGDMCIYNDKLYVCDHEISVPESWNSNNWSYYLGEYSFAEGFYTTACGEEAHSEGRYTTAVGQASHAEGYDTIAGYEYDHAEGLQTRTFGSSAHAEGSFTEALAGSSHAEGDSSVASGWTSHAQNIGTIAMSDHQTALGKYNVGDGNDTYSVIIGNGTADNARSNALTVDWSGNVVASGNVTANGNVYASNIGTIESHVADPVSCATAKYYQVAYLTLSAGVWILFAGARFPSGNTTGIRRVLLTTDTSGYNNTSTQPTSAGNIFYETFAASAFTSGIVQDVKIGSAPISLNESTTIRLIAYQTSGSTQSVSGRFYAVRIK